MKIYALYKQRLLLTSRWANLCICFSVNILSHVLIFGWKLVTGYVGYISTYPFLISFVPSTLILSSYLLFPWLIQLDCSVWVIVLICGWKLVSGCLEKLKTVYWNKWIPCTSWHWKWNLSNPNPFNSSHNWKSSYTVFVWLILRIRSSFHEFYRDKAKFIKK